MVMGDVCNVPITDFYRYGLSKVRKRGFKWVICLLAREADIEGLYDKLCRTWQSIASITGETFLFILAGNENRTDKDAYMGILNLDVSKIDLGIQYQWQCRIKGKNVWRIIENQTSAVNDLRDYFSIFEKDIPCLVFTSLVSEKNQVIPIKGDDIYGFLKCLFNEIAPKLKTLQNLSLKISIDQSQDSTTWSWAHGYTKGTNEEIQEVINQYKTTIHEIETIIENSRMTEKVDNNLNSSITVTGGNVQITTLSGNAKAEVSQNNGVDLQLLSTLIENVKKAMPTNLSAEDTIKITDDLKKIQDEMKKLQPQKRFLESALNRLQAITEPVGFIAAVVTLVEFIQKVF